MNCSNFAQLRIGNFTYDRGFFTVQPFGYKEDDTILGLTAEKVTITALMDETEWQSLLYCFQTWRTARLSDDLEDIQTTVGSTVKVSMVANGIQWNQVDCYFFVAPQGVQLGVYVEATVELVNAAQQVEIAQKQEDIKDSVDYFGTFKLWETELKLRQPPETYQDMPSLSLSAGGVSYTNGPTSPTQIMTLVGDTDKDGWDAIYSRCKDEAKKTPEYEWFPVSAPTASAEKRIVNGVRSDLYTVSINVAKPQI